MNVSKENARIDMMLNEEVIRIWESICPSDYRKTDIKRLLLEQPKAKQVLEWEYSSRGLLIFGGSGTRKTRSVYMLIHRMLFSDEWEKRRDSSGSLICPIEVITMGKFGHACIERFGDGSFIQWTKRLSTVPVLFLDDFGKDVLTDRVESELLGIIENRTSEELPIIITTNFDSNVFLSKFTKERGKPMLRRIKEYCQPINFGVRTDE